MSNLKERILKDGQVFPNNVLKVDSFLNHQIDPTVVKEIATEIHKHFADRGITKVFTIEASGIAPAILVAAAFEVPMLFAKKSVPSTMHGADKYVTKVHSYTKDITSDVIISQQYLNEDDVVLIIDDFLANGEASIGLIDLVKQAGAKVAGVGICIEKTFQPGRQRLEEAGAEVYSICRIASLEDGQVTFAEGN
ncbi:xanthine phosphoribosyltransferase [Aerococcus urinaehominis]|uniref:Xanthine phosphoribosyltransferase n=1 Tax=Aerococcus urinaehominis TaxID=128944 RepID=A0A120IAY8_9LACT|nr:xanthine phosphoribosyltransferase [Aerococcus urinaehominis]AMB99578.1 xanthine phosphoribosyltransferase [Aerococcus urinaehominis]SDL86032.1 xanthine phosphoribosyltransferase [Aerococcus urinaehominis]